MHHDSRFEKAIRLPVTLSAFGGVLIAPEGIDLIIGMPLLSDKRIF
jgi:hypothetical protein